MVNWTPKLDWTAPQQFKVLIHLHKKARGEIDFLRMRQDSVFQWSSSLLLLVIGALLVIDSTELTIWSGLGVIGQVIASLALLIIVLFSVRWQQRNRQWQEESVEVMERIEALFRCYEKGYYSKEDDAALFPERWADPRDPNKRLGWRRLFRVNYVSAVVLLGALAIAMVWLSAS